MPFIRLSYHLNRGCVSFFYCLSYCRTGIRSPNYDSQKIYFVLFALTVFFSSTVSADQISPRQIQLGFEGNINPDQQNAPFTVIIEYSSHAMDLSANQDCCGKYVPMSITFIHDNEVLTNPNAGLNVDNIPSEQFEGIQWVDDEQPWAGSLFGQAVKTLGINFGNQIDNIGGTKYTGTRSKDLPLKVDLDEWDYHNGGFTLEDNTEYGFEIRTQVYDDDQDGVFGRLDQCPGTDADAVTDADGCSVAQLCPADAFRNHGQRMSCAIRTSKDFVQRGLVTEEELGQLISSVANND